MPAKLRVTLVRSPISHTQRTRGTLRALGLHRLGETVEVADNPQMRGMARAVRFLVVTEEVSADEAKAKPTKARADDQPAKAEPSSTDEAKPARRSRKKEESTTA
jgi:large subunit ribosomal protein L30